MNLSTPVRDALLRAELKAQADALAPRELWLVIEAVTSEQRGVGWHLTVPWKLVGPNARLSELSEFFRQSTGEFRWHNHHAVTPRCQVTSRCRMDLGDFMDRRLWIDDVWMAEVGSVPAGDSDDVPAFVVERTVMNYIVGREGLVAFIERHLDLIK